MQAADPASPFVISVLEMLLKCYIFIFVNITMQEKYVGIIADN